MFNIDNITQIILIQNAIGSILDLIASSAIDSHALCLISKNKPTRYNEGVHLNEFPTVTGNCMMFVNEATGFITQMQHGVSLGCSLFVTSEECAIPFLENFYEIHDWVEEKYEKKILAVIDTQNILSNQRIMDILRHRTVLNDLPLTLILQSNIDWIDIWSAFPYSSYYQIYNRFFLGNFSLQYEKPVIPKITDLNGIDVFGAFINYPPYSAYIHVAPGTGNAHLFNSHEKFSIQLEGQEHTLLVEFCIKYNCTLTARLEYDDELWGASYPNHTGSGLVGALIMRDANVSCAAIYLWDDTNVFTQYSAIIQKATVTLIVPQPLPLPYWESPILPFPAFIWGCVIGAFLIGALTLSVVNATKTKLNRQNKQEERGLFDSIYAVFMISIFQGVSISIKLLTDMVIYTVILMYALVIGNLYLSGLASVMTITRFEEPVDSVQKLVDSEFIWGGTTLNWIFDIRESEDPVFQRFTAEFNVKSPMEVQKLVQQRKMAVTVEILQHGTLSYQPFIDKEGSKYYMMMKDPLYSQLTVIMTSKTWPFMEQLNRIAYMQQESGIRYYWELKAAYKTTDYDIQRNMDKNGKPSEGEGAVKLSIQHILGALFFLAFGTITASIFFLLELLFFSKKKKFTIKERTFLVGSGK